MTTRDPRYRGRDFEFDFDLPDSRGGSGPIEPTQSLSLPSPDDEPSHPSLALGTHEAAAAAARDAGTRVESPNARIKPPQPQVKRPPPVPSKTSGDEPERVGQTLGSYKVLEILGKGGMGYVFRAEHVKLGREVALKLLRSDYAKRRDAVARFFQEARTVNRVRHRNIVDVTDFVELEDGTTFIIMEFLRGQSLGRWARTGIDMPRALAVLVQICDGLAAAHSVGVVHRDLKPDNVIVVPTSDGAELVKLLDFGVAKLLNRDDEDVGFQTAAGSVIGTPAYMSPEQAGGMAIDHRSDIYSLGAIMYELFCGAPMFRGRSFGEYVRKHLTEMPVPPSQTEAGKLIDHRLEALIMCCLQKDPNQRFPTIGNLREALLGILGAIETHPPGYGTGHLSGHHSGQLSGSMSMSMSGVASRPMPGIPRPGIASSVAAVMPTMLPANLPTTLPSGAQPVLLPTMAAPRTGMHSISHQQLPSAPYGVQSGYTQHPSTYVPAQTPWWVWAIGGTIAATLGITAAVWYAGRDTAKPVAAVPVATPRPEAQPIEDTPRAAQIEVRFDSTPSGAVFAEGKAMELCRTPCTHNINLQDGGATDQRNFVVRAEGFVDKPVVVDLSAAGARDFTVKLDPTPTIKPPEQIVVKTQELEPEGPSSEDGNPRPGKRPTTKKVTKTTKTKKDDSKPEPEQKVAEPEPDEPDPVPKKKQQDPKKIDQAQTLDPFRKKK